ncbi:MULTISPECIES: hypothetical protein [Gordonia]|uniref:hypothetical protein n=1 Tax=Gordonia TaxID=2053 RepID=UPI0033917598
MAYSGDYDDSRVIAALRLSGPRFDGAGMPADSLLEVAAFDDLMRTLVEMFWRDRHPGKRLPGGYDSSVGLRLTEVLGGSAVPVLEHEPALDVSDMFGPTEVKKDFDRAMTVMQQYVHCAYTDQGEIPVEIRRLPPSKLKKFGQTLNPREGIQVSPTPLQDWSEVTTYTAEARSNGLVKVLGEYTKPVVVEGLVAGFNPEVGKLTVKDRGRKTRVVVPYTESDIKARIEPDRQIFDCRAEGVGTFKSDGRLVELETGATLRIVDLTEDDRAASQGLEALASLEEGWLDGDAGDAISAEVIDRGREVIKAMRNLGNITRSVFPTEEGGVRFYWPETENQLSIEVEPSGALYVHTADVEAGTFQDATVPEGAANLTDRLATWLIEEDVADE